MGRSLDRVVGRKTDRIGGRDDGGSCPGRSRKGARAINAFGGRDDGGSWGKSRKGARAINVLRKGVTSDLKLQIIPCFTGTVTIPVIRSQLSCIAVAE